MENRQIWVPFDMRTLKSNGVLLPMKAVNVIFPMDRQTTDLMPDRKKKLQQKKAQTVQLKFMSQKLLWQLNL